MNERHARPECGRSHLYRHLALSLMPPALLPDGTFLGAAHLRLPVIPQPHHTHCNPLVPTSV